MGFERCAGGFFGCCRRSGSVDACASRWLQRKRRTGDIKQIQKARVGRRVRVALLYSILVKVNALA